LRLKKCNNRKFYLKLNVGANELYWRVFSLMIFKAWLKPIHTAL
jgi:hypothetical protein